MTCAGDKFARCALDRLADSPRMLLGDSGLFFSHDDKRRWHGLLRHSYFFRRTIDVEQQLVVLAAQASELRLPHSPADTAAV